MDPEDFKRAWETFKAENKARDEELKANGRVAAQTADKLDRVNAHLDELEAKLAARVADLERRTQLDSGSGASGRGVDLEAQCEYFRQCGRAASPEAVRAYGNAFVSWLRKGPQAATSELSVGSDPGGGYLVKPDMNGRIISRMFETSPIRALASVQTISGDKLQGPTDRDEADAGWVADGATRTVTNAPTVGEWEIPVHELYAEPKARQTLLDDASVNIESWLTNKIADKLARLENTAAITGNGVGKWRGLTSYTTAATDDASRTWGQLEHVVSGASGGFHATNPGDAFLTLEGAFQSRYLANARWFMKKTTRATVRTFKDGQGNYLWQPDFQRGGPGTLIGYPIEIMSDMPAVAANALAVGFGDLREGYQIVDKPGLVVIRDVITNKGWVRFYTSKRSGGAVIDFDAIKFIKIST